MATLPANSPEATLAGLPATHAQSYRYLVEALRDLDYAPSRVAALEKQMLITRANIAKEELAVASLSAVTKRLLKDWHDSQGNSGRRLWAKVIHTADLKDLTPHQIARHKAYQDALDQEQAYRLRLRVQEGKDAELVQQVKDLHPVVTEHARLRTRLDSLYLSVFQVSGAAAAYPEQDKAERAFESARAWLRELEPMLLRENSAQGHVVLAFEKAKETVRCMRIAHRIVVAKGSEASQIEAQREATAAASAMAKAFEAARKLKPSLENIVMPRTVLSDMFRFCGWSAIGRADIERALEECQHALTAFAALLDRNTAEVDAVRQKTERARAELQRTTDILEVERRRIFDDACAEVQSTRSNQLSLPQSCDNGSIGRGSVASCSDQQPCPQPPSHLPEAMKQLSLTMHVVNPTSNTSSPHNGTMNSATGAPLSPPPIYGQPAVFPPAAVDRRYTVDSLQPVSPRSSIAIPSGQRADMQSPTERRPLPTLSPVSTRDLDTCKADTPALYTSQQPPVSFRTSRSMSSTSNDSSFTPSTSVRQRPLPKTPRNPPCVDTFVSAVPTPPPRRPSFERPRAQTLPGVDHQPELEPVRAHTLPYDSNSPSTGNVVVSAVPEHDPPDLAKLRREGERALQEVQRATEELERIRRELVTRANGRGSGDSDELLALPDSKSFFPRRHSQQPPPTYSERRRDDERGFFYVRN